MVVQTSLTHTRLGDGAIHSVIIRRIRVIRVPFLSRQKLFQSYIRYFGNIELEVTLEELIQFKK